MATFTDLRGDFRRNPVTGDIDLFVDEESISESIKNIVFFNDNEVLFQPNSWGNVEKDLFEPLTPITAKSIRDRIFSAVNTREPRIEQLSVNVTINRNEDGYDVVIKYLPKKSIERETLNLFLERSV